MNRPAKSPRSRSPILCAVFFLSGAAALIFETLWFRLAGLAFGNSVWASALVLSSFMAGLALGNGLAARYGERIRRPAHLYAVIELLVGATGILIVLLLPALTDLLTPVFRPLLDHPVPLNALRLSISFLLLMVPATAMGLTLPLLVKALLGGSGNFGKALGELYGWNTLGAVAGALLGETLLIEAFGIAGAGFWAGSFNLVAAAGAFAVARSMAGAGGAAPAARPVGALPRPSPPSPRVRRLLAASFFSGGILLALEVVWFRFLQLFFLGTSLTFAAMLSVVLAAIGLGGLTASLWFRVSAVAHRRACGVALASGVVSILVYASFDVAVGGMTDAEVTGYGLEHVHLLFFLMFPVAFLSGILFSLIGQAVHEELGAETRSAGLATMANTIGAALGPLVAGFLLIPRIGMERSFFVLALLYAVVALLLFDRSHWKVPTRSFAEYGLGLAFVGVAAVFPFGHMERYMDLACSNYRKDGSRIVARREGTIETIQYLRADFLGQPAAYRLVTNSYSMSGTRWDAKRYMKNYVYWPIALHPDPRNALLISFGCGSTAKALTDTRGLESIDVVDISREILDMSDFIFPEPGENPLDDPRVDVHIEDGRFFLQTTDRRFDLITADPPPPKAAGVVNLCTQEYFQLIHDRLAEGGFVTYWLPVIQLGERDTKAIVKAFFNVFGEETTLWTGCGLDWMLAGSRNAREAVTAEQFARQWNDPVVGPEMRSLGFEFPGQIGATFLMDAEGVQALTADSPPLTDNWPKRLSVRLGTDWTANARYAEYMDTAETRERFKRSPYVRRLWPEAVRQDTLSYFPAQSVINGITVPSRTQGDVDFGRLHYLLSRTSLRVPILWAFDSSAVHQAIVAEADPGEGRRKARASYHLGVRAMADRDFVEAERHFARFAETKADRKVTLARIYLLCLAERFDDARRLVDEQADWFESKRGKAFLEWLSGAVGFRAPSR